MTNIVGKRVGIRVRAISIVLGIIVLDQLTKYAARRLFSAPLRVTSFFSFQIVQNTGASFGIFQNSNTLLIIASIIIIAGLMYHISKEQLHRTETTFYLMIIGGALANLVDRILFGSVTDCIAFSFWPIFNVADSAITLGVIGLLILAFKHRDSTRIFTGG